MSHRHGYNELKREALRVFESRGWLNPLAWAVLARFWPIRASYSYLLHLHRQGLLYRRRDARGLVLYRISERGRARLAWLRQRHALRDHGDSKAETFGLWAKTLPSPFGTG